MLKFYLITVLMCISPLWLLAQKSTIDHLYDPLPTYWGLQSSDNEKDAELCEACWHPLDIYKVSRIERRGSGFWLYMNDITRVKALFSNRRDAISMEFVARKPVACEKALYDQMPSRRNGESLFNGMLLKPVCKREIFKPWKKQQKAFRKWQKQKIAEIKDSVPTSSNVSQRLRKKKIKAVKDSTWEAQNLAIFLGENPMPDSLQDSYAYNLIFIKKKRICRIEHFSIVRGAYFSFYEEMPLVFEWPDSAQCKFKFPPDTITGVFRIPFDQGEANLNYELIKDSIEALGTLEGSNFEIKGAKIHAYTSVEGDLGENECLTYSRAKNLIEAIEDTYDSENIVIEVQTNINWRLFREQLAAHPDPHFQKMKNKPQKYLEKLVSDPIYTLMLEPLLHEQRKATISILIERKLTDFQRRKFAIETFHQLIERAVIDSVKVDYSDLKEAICWQRYIYEAVKESPSRYHLVAQMNIPTHPEFSQLHNNYLQMLELYTPQHQVSRGNQLSTVPDQLSTVPDDEERYELLKALASQENPDPIVTYNRLVFLLERWTAHSVYDELISPDSMFQLVDQLAPKARRIPGMDIDRLWLNYHIKSANYYLYKDGDRKELLSSLDHLYKHYKDEDLNVEHAMGLARLFISGRKHTYAEKILAPLANQEEPDHLLYSLYLKLFYQHLDEYPDTNFYKYLLAARKILGNDDWCQLFKGDEAIEFQVLDHELVRETYCGICE